MVARYDFRRSRSPSPSRCACSPSSPSSRRYGPPTGLTGERGPQGSARENRVFDQPLLLRDSSSEIGTFTTRWW